MYKCMRCGSNVEELPKGLIRCPNCAARVLFKARDPGTKAIKAR